MVVRTATLALLVTDIEKARASLDSLVNRVGGFVGQMDTSGARGEARWLTTTLRVPEQRLADAVAILKTLGTVQSESQGGEDTTDQAADLDARLANARETEKRLVTALQQRTGKVSDVLEVEREIARVRESIERMTSQREQLRDRVTYATISLRVAEETKVSLDLGTLHLRTVSQRARRRHERGDGSRTDDDAVPGACRTVGDPADGRPRLAGCGGPVPSTCGPVTARTESEPPRPEFPGSQVPDPKSPIKIQTTRTPNTPGK